MAGSSDACPRCGMGTNTARPALREMVIDIVCVGLVLVILVPVWFMTERRLEQHSQRVLDHMIWREPFRPLGSVSD
jgi:hypothetical protein